jgi:Leucine-rich repeat (LRR) protein
MKMRMHPFCLLLAVASTALAKTATQTSCIVGCKCREDTRTGIVRIHDCDSPLVLTPEALADVSKKTTTLSFKNVEITHIEGDAFKGFEDLEKVIVEDSTIGSIDSSAFDSGLPELGTINFSKVTFAEVPSLASQYLEELIFNDCQLRKVPNLEQLPALDFLNLANNFIKEINESTFVHVPSLEEVNLSNNSITKLPPYLFAKNEDFNTLNLDDNPLETFVLENCSALELLSLRNCKLTTFDSGATKNLKSLTSLDLSGNQISVLPIDVFEPIPDLNFLNLSNNKLVELDDDIFAENINLDRIVLDNNPLDHLPKFQANGELFKTYTFSCKNCGLKSIDVFENMRDLITLDLSNNQIQDIDGIFTKMQALKELSLSNNQIRTVGVNSFAANSSLKTLDLSGNPLLPLDPVVFATISYLKKLNISNSNLEQLWTNHNANLPSLEELYAKDNKLTVVTVDDVSVIPKLKLIDLENNPLACTESVDDLIYYLVSKSIYPKDAGESIIKTHEELRSDGDVTYNPTRAWEKLFPAECIIDSLEDTDAYNDLDSTSYEMEYNMDDKTDVDVQESVLDTSGFNLAKASYILSITSVFILTALLVLFVAVVITLLILKRNKSFNMHNGNLPRLKIPLWHTTPGQKKHSGSVYKPLSEELSGPRTPIINRYEFKQTPQVHNSIP